MTRSLKDILFSEGTYQVEFAPETKGAESVWPFLQVSDTGKLLDSFCSCDEGEGCSHLAAALQLINADGEPLHIDFRKSLFSQIAHLCIDRFGYDVKGVQASETGIHEATFEMTVKGKRAREKLDELLFHREVETEETSLKFSKLSEEEIALWRAGRPSPELKFELSFWSDLAKWWFFESKTSCKLAFSGEAPPRLLTVELPDITLTLELSEDDWPKIIPTLTKLESPLPVHTDSEKNVESVTFDEKEGSFSLKRSEEAGRADGDALELGDWLFAPGKGFFPKTTDSFLHKEKIEKTEVGAFLDAHSHLAEKSGTFHPQPVSLCYDLKLDAKGVLHVEGYLHTKGDLEKEGAHFFGGWAFLPNKGFYQIEEPPFPKLSFAVPAEELSDFIRIHRIWLQGFEGFQPHVSGVESHLGYRFEGDGSLVFFTRHEFSEEAEHILDLGEWIYVEGRGFYAKKSAPVTSHVQSGTIVEPNQISQFISKYRDELEGIRAFFADRCPLTKSGLNIHFNGEGRIELSPEFFFVQGVEPSKVHIYGDYTYLEGEGFSLIPLAERLPETYKTTKVIEPIAEAYFIGYELELLYPHVLSIDPRLKRPSTIDLRILYAKRDPKAKTGQWLLELAYETNMGTFTPKEIFDANLAERPYLFSPAGLISVTEPRFEWIRGKHQKSWQSKGASVRLTTLEFFRLIAFETPLEPIGADRRTKNTKKLLHDFLHLKAPTDMDLSGLSSDLRPYQKLGTAWLWFLYSYGLSGLLCDEMGLGKTHQAMGLIAGVKNATTTHRPRFLVVCPTSVIYHWERLIETFFPTLKFTIFHGVGRKISTFLDGDYDLLLTSYGIVRTENEALTKIPFDLAVFDELQVAKNAKSLTHRSLAKLQARMRLGLSGTPIENHLLELKALFDLVLPTYLPKATAFRDFFINPIEKHNNKEKQTLLSRLIHPFLLRRRKSEVLTELPEKIEEIALCDLSDDQRILYKKLVAENRDALIQELRDQTKPPPIGHIFSLLSKLKQVCNHPSLLEPSVKDYKKHTSGKWDLFLELFSETLDSGQKLVIFTQYLKMLDIFKAFLTQEGITFAEVRGSTKDRKGEVAKFQNNPDCTVFLGSLQASGVGIDLTAASVVIHYDRWWNPAKENQATDRVHRMGQKRGVQVFKLMTKDTLEEQIDHLIESKMALAKGVIGFDEHDQIKGLNRDELLHLLTLLETV